MKGFLSRHEVLGPADTLQYSSGNHSGTRNQNHLDVPPQNDRVWVFFFPFMDFLGHFETLVTPVNCLPSTLTPQTLLVVVVVWLSNFYNRKTNSFK